MINLDDILDMSALSREEIAAIAEHEHSGRMNAAMLAEYLLHIPHGAQKVALMIAEDTRAALHEGNLAHARELYEVMKHFIAEHPEAQRGSA